MRILELFAGIGACSKALERLGIDVEIVDAVENDKYAMASFNAIHETDFEVQDIKDWDKNIEVDLITHGSPCQDFSIAGKQAGGDLGSGTRSSLMYETIRIVGKIRPKYVLWENVKNILSKKHKHNFDSYIETMNILGYNSYYKVLNAKDYGVPQNRERVYTVSIRKDIDMGYEFPEPMELKLKLKDMLEDKVEEKYYLSDKAIQGLKRQEELKHKPNFIENKKIINTIDTKVGDGTHFSPYLRESVERIGGKRISGIDGISDTDNTIKCVQVAQMYGTAREPNPQAGRIYDSDGLSPTMDSCNGGNRMPKVLIKNATKKGYDEAVDGDSVNLQYPDSNTRRGRVGHGVSQTLMANDSMGVVNNYRIRKLTPKECWRLMGFDDEDFEKAQGVPTSNTQLYKQARKLNLRTSIRKNI